MFWGLHKLREGDWRKALWLFYIAGGEEGGWGRAQEGGGEVEKELGSGSWSVLIKMPSPQTGIGSSSPLHLWVNAIGRC